MRNIKLHCYKFNVLKENLEDLLYSIMGSFNEYDNDDPFKITDDLNIYTSINVLLGYSNWNVIYNSNYDIIGIYLLKSDYCNVITSSRLFKKIAPYIEDGSNLAIYKDGRPVYRWIFTGRRCKRSNYYAEADPMLAVPADEPILQLNEDDDVPF